MGTPLRLAILLAVSLIVAAVLKAMVLGDRSGLSPEMNQAFLDSGTYHVREALKTGLTSGPANQRFSQ